MQDATLTVGEVMRTGLPVADATWDIITLAEFLIAHRVKAIPVRSREGGLLGVVGLEDIAAFTHEQALPDVTGWHPFYTDRLDYDDEEIHEGIDVREDENATVASIVRPVLHGVASSTPLPVACRLMTLKKVHRLIVLDEHGSPTGLLTAMDILAMLASRLHEN
jgi:predicted transcriptional regulator